MSTTYTPGPWKPYRFMRDHKGIAMHGVGVSAMVDGREITICEAYPAQHPVAVNYSNMELIAEALAMLEALRDAEQEIAAWRRKFHPSDWPDKPVVHTATRDKIRAILARIDGTGPHGNCPDCENSGVCEEHPFPERTPSGEAVAPTARLADSPYSPDQAEAFRTAARELCNSETGDRIHIDHGATVEPAEGGAVVHCTLFVSDRERAALATEEEDKTEAETCLHCGEERGAGPIGEVWTCTACNGLNVSETKGNSLN